MTLTFLMSYRQRYLSLSIGSAAIPHNTRNFSLILKAHYVDKCAFIVESIKGNVNGLSC